MTKINKPLSGSRSLFRYPFPANIKINRNRMMQLVEKNWMLNRTAVNGDTDIFVDYLKNDLNADIIEVESGKECLTWKIPKHWYVRKGQLRKLNGTVIADYVDNPLYLWTHSISFQGQISREELIDNHIQTDPNRPYEFLYHYRNGYRYDAEEWGFSLPYHLVEELNEPAYFVDIDTDLDNNGTLKVVDAFLPGEIEDTIFIMAHTCHPALVSDGIACIAIAAELYHFLESLDKRKYSYRFLFGPEYFAAAAYLTHADKEIIKNLMFGIFLDMLSNHEPIGYQKTMQGNSLIDKIVKNVIKFHTETYIEKDYRDLWGNDETFYNGAGFNIPTLGLGRGKFREYHYNTDNLENTNVYHMVESIWFLMRITEIFETDFIPVRKFNGPLYLSRYGMYLDPTIDRNITRKIERLQVLMDGVNSCMDIADYLDLDFFFIRDFCNKIAKNDLIIKTKRQSQLKDSGNINIYE